MHFAATAAADIAVYVGRLRHRPKAPVHCTLTHMHTHRHTSHWLHGTPKTDRQQTIGQKGACHTCPIAVQFSGATEIHAYFENLFIAHTPQSVKNIFSLGIFLFVFVRLLCALRVETGSEQVIQEMERKKRHHSEAAVFWDIILRADQKAYQSLAEIGAKEEFLM